MQGYGSGTNPIKEIKVRPLCNTPFYFSWSGRGLENKTTGAIIHYTTTLRNGKYSIKGERESWTNGQNFLFPTAFSGQMLNLGIRPDLPVNLLYQAGDYTDTLYFTITAP